MSDLFLQDFARYEFKYLLTSQQRRSIENEVRQFMRVDGHIDSSLNEQYLVRSLYFDTPHNSAFYEKIDGVKSRSKFRIRTYSRQPETSIPVFLEQKGRFNERTYKHRILIAEGHLSNFINGMAAPLSTKAYLGVEIVEKFLTSFMRQGIRPKVLVDYHRRPYISDYDMNFRVTFDQKLEVSPANVLFLSPTKRAKKALAGWTIMEIKFNRRIPAWFHRVLQAYELRRVSISKFVVGMKTCGLAVDLS